MWSAGAARCSCFCSRPCCTSTYLTSMSRRADHEYNCLVLILRQCNVNCVCMLLLQCTLHTRTAESFNGEAVAPGRITSYESANRVSSLRSVTSRFARVMNESACVWGHQPLGNATHSNQCVVLCLPATVLTDVATNHLVKDGRCVVRYEDVLSLKVFNSRLPMSVT